MVGKHALDIGHTADRHKVNEKDRQPDEPLDQIAHQVGADRAIRQPCQEGRQQKEEPDPQSHCQSDGTPGERPRHAYILILTKGDVS